MGVGHIALALGASKAAPRLNVGWLVLAALLSDFLLGMFAAIGLERAIVPADYASRHYLLFDFPYSHGLLTLTLWAIIFGFLVSRPHRLDARRIWIVAALVVLSHFLLDGLVHVAGLPLAGDDSPRFGLGLWKHMPLELTIETLMSIAGVALYWTLTGSRQSRVARYGIAAFTFLITALTWTQLTATEVPPARELTITWIVVPIIFSAIVYFFDRARVGRALAGAPAAVSNP